MKTRVRRLTSNDYRAVKEIEKIVVDEYLDYLKETDERDTIEPWITPQYFGHYLKTENSFVQRLMGKLSGSF